MRKRVGRYEIIQPIASGGMATVYLGRARGADFEGFEGFERLVAVKAMHPHIASSSEYLAMFFDEANLAARIRHPNVVATLDIVREDGTPLIVMEFIEGPSLHRMLRIMQKTDRRLPLGIALRVMIDVLAGLHAAHELSGDEGRPLNLVHRDVSPQNVLIGCDGVVRLTDFGVAHAEERMARTRTGQLKGKIYYLSPEQVRGETVERRADVYAAGALSWEVLTGRRLLEGKHEAELIYKLLEGADQPPSALNPEVPPQIDAVCMKALSPTPDGRHASAADFAEALEDAADEAGVPIATSRKLAAFVEGLSAHDPAPAGKGPRWVRPSEQVEMHAGSGDSWESAPAQQPPAGAGVAEQLARPRPDQPTTPTVPLDASSLREQAPSIPDTPMPIRGPLPDDSARPSAATPLTHDNPLIASLVPPPKRNLKAPVLVAGAVVVLAALAIVAASGGSSTDGPAAAPETSEEATTSADVTAAGPIETVTKEAVEAPPVVSAAPTASEAAPKPSPEPKAPKPEPVVAQPLPRPTPAPQPPPASTTERYHPGGL